VQGLYRTAEGAWCIDLRWRDSKTGKRKRYSETLGAGTNAATAKARARDILSGALSGAVDPTQDATKPKAFGDAFAEWITHCTAHGIRSVKARKTHGLALVKHFGGRTSLDTLTPSSVEAFKASLLGRNLSPATVNRHVSTLKNFLKWARIYANADASIVRAIRDDVSNLPEHPGRTRYLLTAEVQIVNANLAGWLRPVALACVLTGARLGEITSLRWSHVDVAARVVRFERTKTDRTREVAIVGELASILGEQKQGAPDEYVLHIPSRAGARPKPCRTENDAPDEYVLHVPSRAGASPEPRRTENDRRRDVASKAWAAFCVRHKLANLRAHDLRHHAATMIRRAGGGLDIVARVLGHTNVRTASRYAHIDVDDTRAPLEAASGSFARPLPESSFADVPDLLARPLPESADADRETPLNEGEYPR